MKKQVRQVREEVSEALNKWEEKYVTDIEKQQRENAKMKIWLQVKRIKQAKLSTKNQAFQSAFQYLKQAFANRKGILMHFVKNIVDIPHNKKEQLITYGFLMKIREFNHMEGNSTSTT